MKPVAVVMNMFYTGLGIARSLGERGIPVIGLSAHREAYGNHTRFAEVRVFPDSRREPNKLLPYLLKLGEELGGKALLFPTRDDDVIFLDLHRTQLSKHFALIIPSHEAVSACLDKWQTSVLAQKADVDGPRCWMVRDRDQLSRVMPELSYPCVMKPWSSHQWRQNDNWKIVGGRKAIAINSDEELLAEYAQVSQADSQVLLQEMIPGADDQLFIAACYCDRSSTLIASFTVQKLVQNPPGFGTGCILQTVERPELVPLAARVLRTMDFTGIAEVEFKWDPAANRYKLIEINPRPWDQHTLGKACGVDLIYIAYCEHAGLDLPACSQGRTHYKWIAEDVFLMAALRLAWRRDPQLRTFFKMAGGKRIYGIWSGNDKWPSFRYIPRLLAQLVVAGARRVGSSFRLGKSKSEAALANTVPHVNSRGT